MTTIPRPITLAVARATARAFGVTKILSAPRANPKVAKSAKALGVLTAPLHLAAADSSGVANVCAFAGECVNWCIDWTGNPAYAKGKRRARVNRTKMYKLARAEFMTLLVIETARHIAAARRQNMEPAQRPNATSDVLWERQPVTVTDEMVAHVKRHYAVDIMPGVYANIMSVYADLPFYDYTKVPPKHRAERLPTNYTLTYSYDPKNAPEALADAIARGWNVAVPFQVKRGRALPERVTLGEHTLRVIDGDIHDYRPADERGVAVGLRFKRVTDKRKVRQVGAAAAARGDGFALKVAA